MRRICSVFGLAFAFAISGIGAPSVLIRAPTNNAVFAASPNLTLIAVPTTAVGTVTNVDFYRGTTRIGGTTNASNWSLVWSNVPAASYALRAVATDSLASRGTSAIVNVTITSLAANQVNLLPANSIWKYLDNGTDQGTAWIAPGFPDGGWASGPAQLGYGDGDEATTVSFGSDTQNRFITTYFRTTFVATNAGFVTNLLVHAIRDDGLALYLNGSEIFRDNLAAGAGSGTLASPTTVGGAEESIAFVTGNASPAALINGVNVLAAEIHQATLNSSDISFDLELIAELRPLTNSPPTVIIDSPTNNAVLSIPGTIIISATASDDEAVSKVEFFQNGSKLGEDLIAPYAFSWSNMAPGSYALQAVATDNQSVTATSSVVNITIISNTPPTVSITSPANGASFAAPASIVIDALASDPGGAVAKVEFYANGSKLGEDASSGFSFPWNGVVVGSYQLTAVAIDNFGLATTSAIVSVSATNTSSGPVSPTLIATGSVWKYLDTGVDLGTGWVAPAFNDSAWPFGPAQLGYGETDEATTVGYGTDANNKYTTTYFRRAITINNPGAYVSLALRMLRDDGAVVYLNGTEIFRSSMPAGAITYQTFALPITDDGQVFQTANGIPANLLVSGNNVVAVEIHQATANSSDISFELELTGNTNNSIPAVSISSPANNTAFTGPANIAITATASDSDGTVAKVEFFQGATKIGESFTAPFTFTWTGVPVGSYQLTAVVTDNLNAQNTSAPINVFVTASTAPTVLSVVPAPGAVSSLNQVTVNFSEPLSGVDATDLLVNGVPAASVSGSAASYIFTFPQPQEGTVSMSWVSGHGIVNRQTPPQAFDEFAAGSTWLYNFVDTTRPTVTSISPVVGATLTAFDEVSVGFSEPVSGVNAGDLLVNGVPCSSVTGVGAGDYRFAFTQPTNGVVRLSWASNPGIRDFSTAQNLLITNVWSYVLDTNLVEEAVVINEIMYHPSSHLASQAYIELLNKGSNAVNLTGWKLSSGASFGFPSISLGAGAYLVIAADTAAFAAKYPTVLNVVGPWAGTLSHTGEGIAIKDALDNTVDSVSYADEGDWALRRRSAQFPLGWDWFADHDGLGSSLELINPNLPNEHGANWAASLTANGTPGRVNSVLNTNIAPIISDVGHFPLIPQSTNSVTITAQVVDERSTGVTVALYYRLGNNSFTPITMLDNGSSGDGLAGDQIYAATIPQQTNLAVVEFYVQAVDSSNNTRTWPAPTDAIGTQGANALYQVDNQTYVGPQPIYRVIMTDAERAALDNLNDTSPNRDDQMNATFITVNGTGTEVRYRTGVRLRGASSRGAHPPNFQMHIPSENRWNGVKEINLNTVNTYSQVMGSTVVRRLGLPAEDAFPVQVRVNGENRANSGDPQFGSYVHLEVLDADFAENHFPYDPNGNVYRCSRPSSDLTYQGTDPNSYISRGYSKESNASENDWSDLVALTAALNNSLDADYANAVRQVANVDEWIRYVAVLDMVGYNETSIGSNGDPDDYSMYAGAKDHKFWLFAHDHDSDFGVAGGVINAPLFRPTGVSSVMNRFLKNAEFAPLYFKELKRICDTVYRPEVINPLMEETLGSWAGAVVPAFETFVANRRAYVLSQIPLTLTVTNALPQANGYYQSATATLSLTGGANVIDTRYIKVNDSFASWTAWRGTWTISGVPLQRGVTRVTIQALDANLKEIARQTQDVLYDQAPVGVSGALAGNVNWTAAGGPYLVTANISVPNGATLTIQPGTTVYFAAGTTMTVSGTGRVLAEGTPSQHIRLTRQIGGGNWGSLDFVNASQESRLAYVDFEACAGTNVGGHDAQVHVNNAIVFFDHLTFPSTPVAEFISFDGSSFIVQNSTFPTYPPPNGPEMLHGVNGIPASGYGIFRDNYFGHTYGFNDTIDFTGGQRPGAVLQIINNVFDGATDDHLDLDSTDAWIEGNIFLHAHRDPNRTDDARDTASAISGGVDVGGQFSEWTVINNLFYDVDHAILNKGGGAPGAGRFIFVNNTLVHVAKEWGAGLPTDIAAFNFTDDGVPLPSPTYGAGAYVAGNIIWDAPALTANYNAANLTVIFDNNILPLPWPGPGTNNLVVDPLLHLELINNVTNADWQTVKAALTPRPGSPALGTGIGGFDRGGLNSRGLLVYGEPPSVTQSNSASLSVAPGGTFNWGSVVPPYSWGYTQYKWKLDNGAWSAETSITTSPTIQLAGLASGPHTVYVVGKNDAPPGYYQDDPFVYPPTAGQPARITASRTWVVDTGLSPIRINEILARNSSAVPVGSGFPDLIELYNSGNTPVSLDGMGITDERRDAFKFVFPAGTTIAARSYLVLYADNDSVPAGIHTGFQLDGDGDELYLYSSAGKLVDSVRFGMQIPDFSIGRVADGSWQLTKPTFGQLNVAQPKGDQNTLRINEWLADAGTLFSTDFIELYNPASFPVSLGGMFLTDNPIGAPDLSKIPPLSFIPANGFAVFLADSDPEQGANHLNFKLAPEKGMIGLVSADLVVIDSVVYGSQSTDISQGRSPNGSENIDFFITPTPGSPNPAPVVPGGTQIVLSEILANNVNIKELDGSTPDWIELYNPSTNAVDLVDMSLTDDSAVARRFVFPAGSTIQGRAYYVVFCNSDAPVSKTNTGFGLKTEGGAVFFYDKLATGGSLLGAVNYGIQAPDFSIGTTNGGSIWFLTVPTPRAANNLATLGNPFLLKVNEWMPNPASGEDWFEIYNPNSQPVALGGLYVTDTSATPKKSAIPPLSFIASGLVGFQRFWADSNPVAGANHTNFKLNNTTEDIGIYAGDGSLIDKITYDTPPLGISRGRLPDGSTNIVNFPTSPTPDESNFLPLDNVVINEALTHSDDPFEDAIELFNTSGSAVNIGGWYLSDAKHTLKKFRIPDNTIIGANGFKTFYENQFNPVPGAATSFSLNSAKGDELYLVAATNGNLTGFRAQVSFGAGENGVSFGRYQSSVGLDFVAMNSRTFGVDNPSTLAQFRTGTGLSNSYPKVGPIVISEIMYHPVDNGTNDNLLDEFIELHNIGASSVPLYHPNFQSNTWRLRDAVSFDFPPNTSLAPGAYLLVVSFDPVAAPLSLAAFKAHYNLGNGVAILGPYSGKLDNGSDKVELYKPDAPQTPPDPDAGFVPYILVERVHYADSQPWPATADGTGNSLQRLNDSAYGNDPVNWIAAAPTPAPAASVDTDLDGMPDSWEIANQLNPNDPSDALTDADHDGATNLDEYRAGTDPQLASSKLDLKISGLGPVILEFTLRPGKSYVIEWRNSAGTGQWNQLISFTPEAGTRVIQVPDGSVNAARFYRLRIPVP